VAGACEGAPDSVHLAGWPEVLEPDAALLAEIAEAREIVELGWRARGEAGIKLRQPLRRLYVRGATLAKPHADEIATELRVKEVGFDQGPVAQVRLLPNLPVLGPRLGAKLRDVKDALERGEVEPLEGDRYRVAGEILGAGDLIRGERMGIDGWTIVEDGALSVALDTALDPELEREGRVLDLIHSVNVLRRERGLEVTDRIRLTIPDAEGELLTDFGERIKAETLAIEIDVGGSLEIEKV
jgi:isoleucyl-tRNA synthetase